MIPTSEIVTMTAGPKAALAAKGAKAMAAGRYVATIALASLKRSNQYFDLGFKSVEALAAKLTDLGSRDVGEMLSVGRRLLDHPELDRAYREGDLNWSKVRALAPHVKPENVSQWIAKAIPMTSNALERAMSGLRDPSVGGPTRAVNLRLPCYARLTELANGLRIEAGDTSLSDEECLMRLLDELVARREADRLADAEVAAPATQGCEPNRHIPASIRKKAMDRARHACEVKGCRNRFGLEVHHRVRFCDGGSHSLDNLMVVCHRCHVKMHRDERCQAPPPPTRESEQVSSEPVPQESKPANREAPPQESRQESSQPPPQESKPASEAAPLREEDTADCGEGVSSTFSVPQLHDRDDVRRSAS